MSTAKHTPGPWLLKFEEDQFKPNEAYDADIYVADKTSVIWACGCCNGINAPNKADLMLMAAAPEMLEVLEVLAPWMQLVLRRNMWTYDSTWQGLYNNLEAAIAKAKGATP